MPTALRRPAVLLFWRKLKIPRDQAELDAQMLIEQYGPRAREEARTRAHQARLRGPEDDLPRRHWDRVGKIISKRQRRNRVDTATRYLDH
jgi:hypothetical protein